MLGTRLPKNKRFHYEPKFYDPEKEEAGNRRIKFKRTYARSAAKKRSLFWSLFLLVFVIYLVIFFLNLGKR